MGWLIAETMAFSAMTRPQVKVRGRHYGKGWQAGAAEGSAGEGQAGEGSRQRLSGKEGKARMRTVVMELRPRVGVGTSRRTRGRLS